MKKLLLSLLVACSGPLLAQTFNNYYTYPQNSNSNYYAPVSHECSTGGYLMAWSEYGNDFPYITKTDASGVPVWTKKFTSMGTSISNIAIADVGELSWGGYYLLGTGQQSFASLEQVCFVVWLGPSGNPLWTKTYTMNDAMYSNPRLHELPNGDLAIMMSGMSRAALVKTDAYGTPIWMRAYAGDTNTGKNPGFDTRPCDDGGFLTSGKADSDAFLVKTDAAGQVQWSKIYHTGYYTHPRSILETSDGNYILAGLQSMTGYMMKIDPNGNILWHKEYQDAQYYGFIFERAAELSNGDIALFGSYMSGFPAYLRTDANGNVITSQYINDNMVSSYGAASIKKLGNDALLISGYYSASTGTSPYMLRTDAQGNLGCNTTPMGLIATTMVPTSNISSSAVYQVQTSITLDSINVTVASVTLTPNEYCMVTSVAQNTADNTIKVFPNPSHGETVISLPGDCTSEVMVTVHDITGRVVKQQAFDAQAGSELRFDTHGLSAGAYMLKLTSGNEVIGTSKLMIE